MPRKSKVDKQRRADMLAKMPASATRVLVVTAKGQKKYRELAMLADSDVIQTNKVGQPIVMKGQPGRKGQTFVSPANAVVALLAQRRDESIAEDPVLKAARANPQSPDVLQEIILGLGEESASLKFEREEATRLGKDTAMYSSKRVQSLRATADVWLKRMDQLVARTVDLDSPGFRVLFEFIMDTFRQAMEDSNLSSEQIETVFARLSRMIDAEWEKEATARMKKKV